MALLNSDDPPADVVVVDPNREGAAALEVVEVPNIEVPPELPPPPNNDGAVDADPPKTDGAVEVVVAVVVDPKSDDVVVEPPPNSDEPVAGFDPNEKLIL